MHLRHGLSADSSKSSGSVSTVQQFDCLVAFGPPNARILSIDQVFRSDCRKRPWKGSTVVLKLLPQNPEASATAHAT